LKNSIRRHRTELETKRINNQLKDKHMKKLLPLLALALAVIAGTIAVTHFTNHSAGVGAYPPVGG
jgi:hypothetical protein